MSVTLLALDTSDELCSVALLNSSGCHITKSDRARKHADEVLVLIFEFFRFSDGTFQRLCFTGKN